MANKKISELTEATVFAATDELPIVDKSDTTGAASGTTKRAQLSTLLENLPAATKIGIGGGTIATAFHAFGTNPALRLEEVTGSYGQLINKSATESEFSHNNNGSALVNLVAYADDGTSDAFVRANRYTNTSGISGFLCYVGDGSSSVNHALYGDTTTSLICNTNGDVQVGSGSNAASITAFGNVTGSNAEANGGNPTLSLAPDFAAEFAQLADAGSRTYDYDPGADGYYTLSYKFRLVTGGGSYRCVQVVQDFKRVSGVCSLEGSTVTLGTGVQTGVAVAFSIVSDDVRVTVTNTTGSTLDGHYWRGVESGDLPS